MAIGRISITAKIAAHLWAYTKAHGTRLAEWQISKPDSCACLRTGRLIPFGNNASCHEATLTTG
jgi:hypothetical protein